MRALVVAAVILLGATPAHAEEDPPNRTGCCLSFDDSPVNIVFCTTEDACRFGNPT